MAKGLSKSDADLLKKAASEKRATNIWKPEPGQGIVGVVKSIRPFKGRKGNAYLSVTLDTDTGPWVVNCGQVLESEIEEKDVKKGDRIAIHFHGTQETTSGQELLIHSIAVERAG